MEGRPWSQKRRPKSGLNFLLETTVLRGPPPGTNSLVFHKGLGANGMVYQLH